MNFYTQIALFILEAGVLLGAFTRQSILLFVFGLACAAVFLKFRKETLFFFIFSATPLFLSTFFYKKTYYEIAIFVLALLVVFVFHKVKRKEFLWHIAAFFWAFICSLFLVFNGLRLEVLALVFFVTMILLNIQGVRVKNNLIASLALAEFIFPLYYLSNSIFSLVLMIFGCYYFIVNVFSEHSWISEAIAMERISSFVLSGLFFGTGLISVFYNL